MKAKPSPVYRVLDLFAGCGGLTQGFVTADVQNVRFEPVGAVELDLFAAATYASNFGSHVFQGDIADWIGTDLPEADIVVGGPPCQGFSSLGKRDPHDERNKLWQRYAEVVAAVRPQYFVLENVPPFLDSRQFNDLKAKTNIRGALGDYTLEKSPGVLYASDFGAAQKRRRAVVVGRRRDMPALEMDVWKSAARTVRDAIGSAAKSVRTRDLPSQTSTVALSNRTIEVPGTFLTSELHVTRQFTDLSMRRFEAIPEGGNRRDLPDDLLAPCWIGHDGSHDVMGRLHWDRPSVTIRTEFWKPEKGRYLHPVANRPITHMEAALLQGFPKNFKWCGTKVAIGRQIGNAVPVELGRAIASALAISLGEGPPR
jgi:DNA (cytosine-5)-methyltransferase 1